MPIIEFNELLTRFDDDGDVRTKTDVSFASFPFSWLPDNIRGIVADAKNWQVKPPEGWSTLYSQVGGEDVWGADGDMATLLPELGIWTEVVEPLFGMQGYTGGALVLFKAGSKGNTQHYFYSPEELTVRRITQLNDTKAIAQVIQDSDYASIVVEEVEPPQWGWQLKVEW